MAITPRTASRLSRATLSAASTWSSPLTARPGGVYVEVTGTFERYVTIQRSHDDGASWKFVGIYPAGGAPRHIENVVDRAWYRAGFTAAGYASGTATVELAQ